MSFNKTIFKYYLTTKLKSWSKILMILYSFSNQSWLGYLCK